MCEFQADDGVIDQALSECFAFVGVFDGFFIADAGEADTLDDYPNAFVVEICHNY